MFDKHWSVIFWSNRIPMHCGIGKKETKISTGHASLFATEDHPAGLPCRDLIERCLLDEVPRHFDHVPSVGFPGSVQMVNITLTTGR